MRSTTHLGDLKSNSIGSQLWCIVGTRESYARAIEAGEWTGWACSLMAFSGDVIRPGLGASADLVRSQLTGDLDEARQDLALQLLEHEAQHMGPAPPLPARPRARGPRGLASLLRALAMLGAPLLS